LWTEAGELPLGLVQKYYSRLEVNKCMNCEKCSYTGPEGESHYHIVVVDGEVTGVWFVSRSGYWDRELEKDEYFVEYKGD
jgi:hypothetical protein